VEAALDTACAELSQEESEFAKQACGRMLQEFMGCYLFGQRGWNGYMKYLGQLFHAYSRPAARQGKASRRKL
jgi:hypothetical protein